ncbi:class I SAM-dependent methyltransferase [Coralliovum pocilloporae]|uniref:class I SAM-dependent methyltransferase n=1 Tax=Coralliovum pocilloporae TaxID=3066369 RepID=UPI00330746F3
MGTPLQIEAYDRQAQTYAHRMGRLTYEAENQWWLDHLPGPTGLVLDLGAGTGEPARLMARRGHRVLAVEPSDAMRRMGQKTAPDERVTWLGDALPNLPELYRRGVTADFILINSVLIHLRPAIIPMVFKRLRPLLKAHGRLALLHRQGPAPLGRPMYPVSVDHVLNSALAAGLVCLDDKRVGDTLGRPGVSFAQMIFGK